MSISTSVLSIGSPASEVHAPSVHEQRITVRNLQPVSPLDNLVAFSSQPTKLNVMRQVVE